MTAFDYFLAIYFTLNAVLTVGYVGRQREPLEPLTAAIVVALYFGMVTWLLVSRGVLG